ncbi:MAG TPA: lipoprotein-releasing ABC transporter permease subunit [Nitrospirota bacterium]|nr:lipoprotein-releasing ABC transporter permease subunit [Nitrospirota bacterium]
MKTPYEIFVSLRYLKTKKRYGTVSLNTFISIAGVVIGVATSIITLSVMTGFQGYFRDKILAAIPQIVVMEYSGVGIEDVKSLQDKISGVPHVKATTPFTISQAMLTSRDRVQGVVVRGIDPRTEGQVTSLGKNMIEGSLDALEQPGREYPGIVIGEDLARKFGAMVGDTVTMVNPIGEETAIGVVPKMRKFELVGIFDAGMYDYNTSFAYTSLPEAQKFFAMPRRVSGIEVKIDEIYNADRISDTIRNAVGYPYYTRNWIEMNKNFFSALKLEKIGMSLILIVIIIVASFNIIGTLTMIVMEKSREIAILKSMGATAGGIMRIFMFAGLVIGSVGTAIGAVIGYGAVTVITKTGIVTLPRDVYQVSHLPLSITGLDVLFICVTALGISFLATLYPSWQGARQDPVEVLRYE